MNKPRSIPTTIAEPTFSLCPSACFWSYHPCSHDSLHDPPNIFSPLPPPAVPSFFLVYFAPLASTNDRHSASAPFILPPSTARVYVPPPLHENVAKSFSPSLFKRQTSPTFIGQLWKEGRRIHDPRKISRVYKHGTSRRNPDTSPRLILSRTSSEIYNVGNISILCKSIEVSWVSRVYNRDLVCSIITGHGCKRCFSTMDRKHGFIKLLCRPDQRLTNATCPRHAFNPELGKPGYIHVYIYI